MKMDKELLGLIYASEINVIEVENVREPVLLLPKGYFKELTDRNLTIKEFQNFLQSKKQS